ncbi:MAG: hypothetical protein WA274_11500 [Candidatus Acidiferrales bacterium]
MTAVILSHIFVLGYNWFFVDALVVMVLTVIYLLAGGQPGRRNYVVGSDDRQGRI